MILLNVLFAMMFAHANDLCERRFVLAFMDNEPSYFVENGVKKGHSYVLMTDIVKALECRETEIPGSYAANKEKLLKNRVDIMGLAIRDAEMDKVAEFIPAYRVPRMLIVDKKVFNPAYKIDDYLKSSKAVFSTLIGAGFFMSELEREVLFKQKRLFEVPGPADIFANLIKGRAQATFSTPLFTHYYLSRKGQDQSFVILPDPDQAQDLGIYVSKARVTEKDRSKIRDIIKRMKADGSMARSAKDYVRAEDLKYYKD